MVRVQVEFSRAMRSTSVRIGCATGGRVARAWRQRGRTAHREQARIEALATWCEQLVTCCRPNTV